MGDISNDYNVLVTGVFISLITYLIDSGFLDAESVHKELIDCQLLSIHYGGGNRKNRNSKQNSKQNSTKKKRGKKQSGGTPNSLLLLIVRIALLISIAPLLYGKLNPNRVARYIKSGYDGAQRGLEKAKLTLDVHAARISWSLGNAKDEFDSKIRLIGSVTTGAKAALHALEPTKTRKLRDHFHAVDARANKTPLPKDMHLNATITALLVHFGRSLHKRADPSGSYRLIDRATEDLNAVEAYVKTAGGEAGASATSSAIKAIRLSGATDGQLVRMLHIMKGLITPLKQHLDAKIHKGEIEDPENDPFSSNINFIDFIIGTTLMCVEVGVNQIEEVDDAINHLKEVKARWKQLSQYFRKTVPLYAKLAFIELFAALERLILKVQHQSESKY